MANRGLWQPVLEMHRHQLLAASAQQSQRNVLARRRDQGVLLRNECGAVIRVSFSPLLHVLWLSSYYASVPFLSASPLSSPLSLSLPSPPRVPAQARRRPLPATPSPQPRPPSLPSSPGTGCRSRAGRLSAAP